MTLKKENYQLKKFKKTAAGTMVEYNRTQSISSDVTSTVQVTEVLKDEPHPDLLKAMELFDEVVRYDEEYDEEVQIQITGVTYFPNIETAIITHLKKKKSGRTAINSGRISLNSEEFRATDELANALKVLSDEVYKFLFTGKRAQLDIFNEAEGVTGPIGEIGLSGPIGVAGKTKEQLEDEGDGDDWIDADIQGVIDENEKFAAKEVSGKSKAKTSTKMEEGMKVA